MRRNSSIQGVGAGAIKATVAAVWLLAAGLAQAQQSEAAQAPDTTPAAAAQLPTVTIRATAEDTTLQHLDTQVNSGALGKRSQLETPFSTTVVTGADLETRQANKLGDIFLTDASVSDNGAAYGTWASYLSVRGLPLDWQNSYRIDGNPYLAYVTVLPKEHFERIELLKGATGFMYGFGSPGGLINYVTKRPTDEPVRSFTLGYDYKGILSEHVDLGGRAGEGAALGYRLNATHEEGKTYNNGSVRRNSLSLALDARLTSRLTWDGQVLLQDRKVSGQEPSIYTGLLTGKQLPSAVRNDDSTLVRDGTYADTRFRYYATGLTYELAPDWTARAVYSHSTTQTRRNESVLYLQDSAGNYSDSYSDYAEAYQCNQLQALVQGKLRTGALAHELVLGASWQKVKSDFTDGVYGTAGTGSIWSPNTNAYYSQGAQSLYRTSEITQKALFASDTLKLSDRWSVLAGVRYTNYRQVGFTSTGAVSSTYDKSGVLTPTTALMYKLNAQTMAYASYVESLEAGSTVGINYSNYRALLDPLKSKQYEVGIKTQHEGWAATAALFRIEKKAEYGELEAGNSLPTLVQNGLSVYQGLELGATTRLARNWELGGNLMLLDSEYKKGNDYSGNRVAGAPRTVVAAKLSYSVPQLPGLKLHAGLKYTGSTMLRPANDIQVASYTLLNLGAVYDTRIGGYDTTWRLAINNAANKKYWMYQYADYLKAGDPRSVSASATVRF
ncbi:MAG: Ferric-anguibactin receptor FatA [Paracidovorax wautersii]|uniref:Ferric-anguibactin receptor FatA n=1 Tax=Paracidovorax wautersii TaxID=1177982 RepID=A0A7V8JNT8_9BURK|nr:MAG: Ferric-anguibactin receptor FatA [Paracidovorax wautersii]